MTFPAAGPNAPVPAPAPSAAPSDAPAGAAGAHAAVPLGELPLARTTVDRGCERRADPGWLPAVLSGSDTAVLVLVNGRAAVADGRLVLSGTGAAEGARHLVYLGRRAGQELVLADHAGVPSGLHDAEWLGLRDVAAGLGAGDAGLFVEAVAIANWHASHTHCPRCGAPTEVVQSGWVRQCPADGSEHFPRTDPAVIVSITDDADRLLLGANAQWGGQRFSTLAGFVEPGESLEAAVVREVREEAGITVREPRYLGSQPWPFPASLMLGFTARADSTHTVPDGEEIIELRWFTRRELAAAVLDGAVSVPAGASIARALVEHWYGGPLPEPRRLEN
ncbi:NAD(+) diphosphatase [Zafaria sp. Z1313]|uniref:NAD(+) diphosphatase n=1 Tax=unclassified Zafaria TaxID=2828765 RepID=UPI002E7A4732|nr:NAD(+) diphosphatase [Zafaria sp. J156]MEE1620350.1 NAD(+) diphosphatase [Zafaria sp. J156]